VARRFRASRFWKTRVSGASEDFVPPAAQRKAVGRIPTRAARKMVRLLPQQNNRKC